MQNLHFSPTHLVAIVMPFSLHPTIIIMHLLTLQNIITNQFYPITWMILLYVYSIAAPPWFCAILSYSKYIIMWYTYVCTIFICIEAQTFIPINNFWPGIYMYEPFLQFTLSYIYFRVHNPCVYSAPGVYMCPTFIWIKRVHRYMYMQHPVNINFELWWVP